MPFYEEKCNRAGLYYRLSREDGDKRESDSISNQRNLLQSYLKQHSDISFIQEYVDDGYSGTNFERPGFIQMMEDAKSNRINCIIVKDLSRFGRNYIETGRYLERVFPLMGIRFISVTDNYDTMQQQDASSQMIVPFKNLINDAYCRDISTKVRSQFEIKRKNGQYIGGFAPYGYNRDAEDKHHLIVDPYAADIVRMVYDFRLKGMSTGRIARQLNGMGVLPPGAYKKSKNSTYRNGFAHHSEMPIWMAEQVRRILCDEMYTGVLVQGKKRKVSYRVNKYVLLPQENWIKVTDTHESIISKEVFQTVQNMWCLDTRTSPNEELLFPLSGKVRCGSCGCNMVRKRYIKRGKTYDYYTCSSKKRGEECSSHLIRVDSVDNLVLRVLQTELQMLTDVRDLLSQAIQNGEYKNYLQASLKKQAASLNSEIERYQKLCTHAYQDKLDGVISEDEYKNLTDLFHQKQEQASIAKKALEEKILVSSANPAPVSSWLREIQKYGKIQALDRKVVMMLIDRVEILDKNKIHIVFQHEDALQGVLGEYAKSSPMTQTVGRVCAV